MPKKFWRICKKFWKDKYVQKFLYALAWVKRKEFLPHASDAGWGLDLRTTEMPTYTLVAVCEESHRHHPSYVVAGAAPSL
jgi:hypothetical protein